jgi:hypothetical protein
MPGPGLIRDYLAALAAQLPAPVVTELADGLDQTRRRYLRQGLDPDAAAEAAITEFGEPQEIVAAFVEASPARHAARRLLATGPLVGLCWATVLILNRAWTWPAPVTVRIGPGVLLITATVLLAKAAFGRHYRSASRAGAAGLVGVAILDVTMLITAMLVSAAIVWPVVIAAVASAARIAFGARTLRSFLVA